MWLNFVFPNDYQHMYLLLLMKSKNVKNWQELKLPQMLIPIQCPAICESCLNLRCNLHFTREITASALISGRLTASDIHTPTYVGFISLQKLEVLIQREINIYPAHECSSALSQSGTIIPPRHRPNQPAYFINRTAL
ncbi:unnamed protein product [Brugia pahangi]|uniref:Uncharacterized protein n=1 Tax=Brugia pahangi TaxID=6280 RepID=A0A0N4TL90_BRUPA|nr:unnamed protein product [Brugia pahangi]